MQRIRSPILGAELGAGEGGFDTEELQLLVTDGLEKGFLTYDEIAAGLETSS
ncbi:MAG: RNA polymerase sigma factor region1.1 domain-containing protein [Gaiellaceae bacterium]